MFFNKIQENHFGGMMVNFRTNHPILFIGMGTAHIGIAGLFFHKASQSASRITVVKMGAILVPLAATITIATKKIFQALGWQNNRSLHLVLAVGGSLPLVSAISDKWRWVSSIDAGFQVAASLTGLFCSLFFGVVLTGIGIHTLYQNQSASQ